MIDVIVETRGGATAEIYWDHSEVRVVFIDWDELEDLSREGMIGVEWPRGTHLDAMPSDTREQYLHAIDPSTDDDTPDP